ncbi:MAG: UPF0149 family protein [Pseudoxanthomonas sp.]
MIEPSLPDYEAVAQQARALALASTPAELHGGLCGWLCGGGGGPDWLGRVLADPAAPVPPADSALDRLHRATAAQLEDGGFGLALLLPPAEAALQARADALLEWCRAFLGAFGLAAGAQPPLGEDGREALDDLAKLAGARPEAGEGEEDEQALAEIEEFVRVAALLLHGDCVMAARHRRRFN